MACGKKMDSIRYSIGLMPRNWGEPWQAPLYEGNGKKSLFS